MRPTGVKLALFTFCVNIACSYGDNAPGPDAAPQRVAVGEWCAPDASTPWCADGAGLCVTGRCVARCGNACPRNTVPTWIPWDGGHLCLCNPVRP